MAGIYLHFPFCQSKCSYCDFYSIVYSERLVSEYIQALNSEIQLRYDYFSGNKIVDTIYLGGGTPSLLSLENLKDILHLLFDSFNICESTEITIEVNPGNVSLADAIFYKAIGINRISIGAQSFNDNELKLMGRIHNPDDISTVCSYVRIAGVENFSLDLIYGLPGQSLKDWELTLCEALTLKPKHISAYSLSWSPATPLGRKIINGDVPLPQEEVVTEMFLYADELLTKNGYEHYEVSNYALPGYRCRHNEGYWTGQPYLGLGPSAHSFIKNQRFWNISDVREYVSRLCRSELPVEEEEILSSEQQRMERIAVGLRIREGIGVRENNIDISRIEDFVQRGLVIIEGNVLRLTARGMLFTDEVAVGVV